MRLAARRRCLYCGATKRADVFHEAPFIELTILNKPARDWLPLTVSSLVSTSPTSCLSSSPLFLASRGRFGGLWFDSEEEFEDEFKESDEEWEEASWLLPFCTGCIAVVSIRG